MSKILCFGELLIRLSPDSLGEWIKHNNVQAYIGGSELNVARALALWNVPVRYLTALPDNYFSRNIVQFLSKKGIDVGHVNYSGSRIGLYYLPEGVDLKHAGVIYDRSHSSFAELKTGIIDWDEVLKDVQWFHFSAICPALSEQIAAVCEEALKICAKKKITISVDLNYRAKLWQYGKNPVDVMPKLVEYCDVVMGNIWSAQMMLDCPLDEITKKTEDENVLREQALKTSVDIINKYPICRVVANTFRFDNEYFATLFTNSKLYASPHYRAIKIVDKAGSGDCFMAGLIYGLYHKKEMKEILDFSTAAACGALMQKGDSTEQSIDEIYKIILSYGTKEYH